MKTISVLKLLFLSLLWASLNYPQDSHYWNIQYGTKATLLGGAVIGSVSDLSATFYNPGAVSLFEDPKLILSAKVYQLEQITVINGAGENKDLNYSSISPAPTFVAFTVNIDSTGINKLAFSILTRQSMNFEFEKREIGTIPGISGSIEGGGLSLHQKLDDIWGGVTFSHKFSPVVGLGVTAYVAYRNQTTNFQTVAEGLDSINRISSFLAYRNLYFNNYRILCKAGFGAVLRPITLGFTITTPSINILGSGSYGYHNFLNNPDNPGENIYESNYQDDLKSKYNTSWAVGFGSAYWGEKISMHFSAEWYDAVKKYNPISLAPLYSQSSGETFNSEILQQLNSVVNAGIGIDYKLNDNVSFAGGFITDFSANGTNERGNISLSRWDIYHITGGSSFKIGTSEVTLGLAYSFGSNVIRQVADIGTPDAGAAEDVDASADVKFTRIKVIFGFIF